MPRSSLLGATIMAGIMALPAPRPAAAQTITTTIVGGGSTLAMNEYVRTFDAIGTTTNFWFNTATQNAAQTGVVLYAADGSGTGQAAFLSQDATLHAVAAGPVHFGASDAYLSATQIACWQQGSSSTDCVTAGYTTGAATIAGGGQSIGGPIIQLPAFGTPVTLAHTILYSKAVTLNDNDLCGIFSGRLTNWSQTEGIPGSFHPPALNGQISVVYRVDASGTTFLLTQHLSRVCNPSNTASGIRFFPTKYFADLFFGPIIGPTSHTIPGGSSQIGSHFTGLAGSASVAAKLLLQSNAITYLTPDYTSVAPRSVPNSIGPINGWTADAASAFLNIKTAKLYNSHQGKTYPPSVGGTTLALKNPNLTSGDTNPSVPSTLAQAVSPDFWIPRVGDPLLGYPIVGYTTLIFAQCYANPTVAAELKAFLVQLYSAGNKTNLTLEGFTAAPSGYQSVILKSFTKNANGYNLDINNPSLCQGAGAAGVGTFTGL